MSSFNVKRRSPYDTTAGGVTTTDGIPLSSFGEVNVAELTPSGQGDFVYNINTLVFTTASYAGGSVTNSNGMAIVSSGTGITGSGDVSLRRNLKYRPGMGALARATCLFDTPVSGNIQLIGVGNTESGYYFGYYGTNFGIIHQESSQRQIMRLDITTGGGTGTATVTLNGQAISVPVTGGNLTTQTAYQLTLSSYANTGGGWAADVISGSVYFII